MDQSVQVAGSIAVLAGFALATRGVLDVQSRTYLLLNLVGSAVLAASALTQRQWGFLLLNAVWAVVSAASLLRVVRSARRTHATGAGPAP